MVLSATEKVVIGFNIIVAGLLGASMMTKALKPKPIGEVIISLTKIEDAWIGKLQSGSKWLRGDVIPAQTGYSYVGKGIGNDDEMYFFKYREDIGFFVSNGLTYTITGL